MINFLCKTFVKNYEKTTDPEVREGYGKLAGIVGIISNTLLCIAKIVTGIFAGSIAIVADGINNLADASSSIITILGFKLASKPESDDHPYGHARIEYISGMIVSVLIVVVGVELFKSSVTKILNPEPLEFSISIVVVLILSIAIKIWQAMFNINVGKRINSVALSATGADSRNDVIATAVVLVSVIIGKMTGLHIDGYMGCLVAAFIMWSGIGLVKETISPLLGEAPDPGLVDSIEALAMEYDGVYGIHDLIVHNYGPGKIFASVHIEVSADTDIMASHDLVDNIERDLSRRLNILLTCHMDPIKVNDPLVNQMMQVAKDTADSLDGVIGVHDLRIVPGLTHTNIIFDVLISHDCTLKPEEILKAFQDAASAVNKNYFIVIDIEKGYTKV